MRILAVRGRNLASLADPFEIDLAADPIAGAGLFAITGETGAGKSTLLDALCLALYGDFPRIADGADQDVPDVAGQAIKAKDARNILRRNTASGHAEVDFIGIDGAVYRARWEVARAHGRADRRLQAARRSLVRLDADGEASETLADRTTTVTARVVELTDLTFDQFRRTVVLAQGEFDAFLRAADADRADLLEKITGTKIYAHLSTAAFDRAKAAREAVERARERRTALGLLAPEVRAEKGDRRAALGAEIAVHRLHLDAAGAQLAALDRLDVAHRRVAEAEAAAEAAAGEVARAAPERDRLAAIDRARTLRPVIDAHKAAHRAEAEAVEALAEAETRLNAATPRYRDAGEARKTAEATRDAVEARIAAFRPLWDAAAGLDVRIGEAERRVGEAESPARQTAEAVAARRAEADGIVRRRADVLERLGRLRAEAARHPELAGLVERWEEIAERLAERARRRIEADAARARRAAAVERGEAADRDRAAIDAAAAERAERRTALEARLGETRTRLLDLREEEARARGDLLARLAGRLGDAPPLVREAAAMRAGLARAEAEGAAARAEFDRLAAEAPALVGERDDLLRSLRDGAAADRLAAAVESAVARDLREALVDGAPCPVCGATEHPILADPSIRAALATLREERARREARRHDLDAAIADLERRRAGEDARASAAATVAQEARARLTAAETALAALDTDAADLAAAVDLDWLGLDATPQGRLAAAPAAIEELRRPLAERLAEAEAARAAIDTLRGAIDLLDRDREADDVRRTAIAVTRAEADRDHAVAGETERQAEAVRADLDRALAPHLAPLSIGPAELDRDGETIAERLAEAVGERRRAGADIAALTEEEHTLEREELRIAGDLAHLEQARVAAETTLADLRAALAGLRAERRPLLDGEPTEVHRARMEAARIDASAAFDAANVAHAAAAREHDAALTQIAERRGRLQKAQAETSRAGVDCERALAGVDLDWERAAALLAIVETEVETLRERLAGLAETRVRTATEAAARHRDLVAATADAEGLPSRAELVETTATGRSALDALNREFGALDEILAADDAAHLRAAEVDTEIANLEAENAVWAAIDQAIGSASGDKFRRFAQGVTLDRLTALADRHLATLAPRYRLIRTDGLGLAICDRDMGDELRSTRSLSGGERFLASLALALSLSGLEGRRSFVDTLFIDEGFGALDAATLDVAIDALESLQSEGRKVGVISHVAALHDRIPVQIRVERAGLGVSRVRVRDRRAD